ncbi:FecR family protein [Sphingomonas sp. CJ20]
MAPYEETSPSAKTRDEAASWFARLRGPDGERLRPDFEAWRAADPMHAAAYAEVEAMWRRAGGLAHTKIGRARQLPARRAPLLSIPFARPALAGLAALAVAGLAYTLLAAPVAEPVVAARVAPVLATAVGEMRSVRLSDGSAITLDTDSAVEIGRIGDLQTLRLLRGRARFDVRSSAKSLRVEADGRMISASDTTFDVNLAPPGGRISILRGTARIDSAQGTDRNGQSVRLMAGQCLTSFGAQGSVRPFAAGATQWVSGMLSFDRVPLAEVIAETNRYSSTKIRLASQDLAMLPVTGAFRPLPVDALAAALAEAFGLRAERAPEGWILRRKG